MKKILIVLTLQIISFSIFAQDQNTQIDNIVQEAIALHDSGEYEKAIEKYKTALSIDPNSSVVNYEIAYSYFSMHDYKNAQKYSKKVIKINDVSVLDGYILYGTILDVLGKPKKSIKVYEKAMKDFDHYLLYYNHAISCFNNGETEKAYESTIKAINNNSSHASSHMLLSQIMERKGNRVKAMLPIYFFLLLEPNSDRATTCYNDLRRYIDHGVTEESSNTINVVVPLQDDSDFGGAEMMLSLSKASNNIEENKGKTELQLFNENNENLFNILGELKENTGFWWDFYVPFFYEIANENLTEVYSFYISLSLGEEVSTWFDNNNDAFERFKQWMSEE